MGPNRNTDSYAYEASFDDAQARLKHEFWKERLNARLVMLTMVMFVSVTGILAIVVILPMRTARPGEGPGLYLNPSTVTWARTTLTSIVGAIISFLSIRLGARPGSPAANSPSASPSAAVPVSPMQPLAASPAGANVPPPPATSSVQSAGSACIAGPNG